MDAIMLRRSTRKYLDKPVESDKIERILRAAMQSPTGHNAQDWEFLVITDPLTRQTVSEMGPYSKFAAEAPLQIIVLANMDKAWKETPLWSCDMGAVCQTILIQTEEEGLGACWMGAWPHEERAAYLREKLGIPENIIPYAVIGIGYKQYEKKFDDRFDAAKIHWEKY